MISEVETLFTRKIMELMDTLLGDIKYNNKNFSNYEKFEYIKRLSSLTAELIKKKDIHDKMYEIAKSSKVNVENISDKFDTFTMIRNVLLHFPIFDSWEDVYISKSLLEWNDTKSRQIKKYFSEDKSFSYKIYLYKNNKWVPSMSINIKISKLDDNSRIYLKDVISLDDAIWTFAIIDYYLQFVGLNIEPRFLISA